MKLYDPYFRQVLMTLEINSPSRQLWGFQISGFLLDLAFLVVFFELQTWVSHPIVF